MTDTCLQAVAFAASGPAAATFQRSVACSLPVEEVVARLKHRIEAAKLWVLHDINPQMLLHRGGYAIGPARQILFFHPRLMSRLLAADSAALLEAPLKFAVIGFPEGPTELRWLDPRKSFERYRSQELTELGSELAGLCEEIAAIES